MTDERRKAIRELVSEWLRHSRSDLVIANMIEDEEVAPEILAFHAQRAVEKALKALLVQRQVEFPRTHVIGVLLTLCSESGYVIAGDVQEAVTLTRYAVTVRYPGESEPVSQDEARQAMGLANRIFQWAENQIGETG